MSRKSIARFLIAGLIAIQATLFQMPAVANAALVTGASDVVSDETAGASADHTVTFTTPTGAAEGDTITLTFASDFDTSTLTEDDVDVSDDGVDLTTAATCAGAEEASVAIGGDVVTITICAGDGGAIAATSVVEIQIGENATASGTGANQVVNPADSGTYLLAIGGTFSDFGSIAVPIVDPGTVSVTATVPASGGGGGGGSSGGGGGDTEAPNVFNVQCTAGETTLTVSWETDEASDSAVDYGETVSYEIGSESDATLELDHEIILSGLSAGVTYHFEALSADESGNTGTSGDQTCATVDTTGPVISNIDVTDETESTATIIFDTDEDAICSVEYGTDTSYGNSVSETSSATSHTIDLSGLDPGTEYHFQITCEDASGNETTSPDQSFTTQEDLPPTNASDFSCVAGDASISFSWSMPSETDLGGTFLNCDTSEYPSSPADGLTFATGSETTESVAVGGLTNDQIYYCALFVYDQGANFSSGAIDSCTPTAGAVVPPAEEEPAPEEEVPPTEEEPTPEEEAPGEEEPTPEVPGEEVPGEETPGEETPTEEVPTAEIPEGPPAGPGEGITSDDVDFLVAEDTITLIPAIDVVAVIPDRPFHMFIPEDTIAGKTVADIYVTLDGSSYLLGDGGVEETNGYSAYIAAPGTPGEYPISLRLVFTDGTTQDLDYTLDAVELGYVYEVLEGAVSRVPNAIVTLMVSEFGVWQVADVYQFGGQPNPDASASDGTFAWYVANGVYRVEVTKAGYADAVSGSFTVRNNIATTRVMITRLPIPLDEILAMDIPLDEKLGLLVTESLKAIDLALENLRSIPEVQVATDVAIPATVIIGVASLGLLAGLFNLLPLLQYIITSPILFLWKGKRRAWGIVYNAANKLPIDLAIVRLYKLPENKLVMTRVTDKQGRYFFLAQPGEYRIVAVKPGFDFPSEILMNVKEDGKYLDVYHGETIRVNEKNATIAANIPLDPSGLPKYHEPGKLVLKRILRRLQNTIAFLGIFIALFILIIRPSALTLFGFVFQTVLYLCTLRLAKPRRPKSWGIVYDSVNHQPLGNSVVRIFEPKYNKLLETAITDSKGRYSFLVGPSEYFTTYEKPGFEKREVRPIDTTTGKTEGEIAIDIELSKAKDEPPSTTP